MVSRARALLVALALALAVPAVAAADHTTCDPTAGTPCPAFDPQLDTGPQVPYTDTPSDLVYRWTQADHTMPVVAARLLVPAGWGLRPEVLRPAQREDGTPAAACQDIYVGTGQHRDNVPAALTNTAEVLTGGLGMTAETVVTRDPNHPRNRSGAGPIRFGYSGLGNHLSFLDWDAGTGTARMCLYLYAQDLRADGSDDPDDRCNQRGITTNSTVNATNDPNCERSREQIVPVALRRIQPGDPLSGRFGWSITFDLTGVYRDRNLVERNEVSITRFSFALSSLTAGNWHRNAVTGELQPALLSRTPVEPGGYEFGAVLSTCRDGLNPIGDPQVCRNGALLDLTRSSVVDITPPPSTQAIHDFARITGPTGPGTFPAGFALIRNSRSIPITWNQPAVATTERIHGYALVVARPNDQAGRDLIHLVTDPSEPGFDPRMPCGPSGANPVCALTVDAPADGRFDIALVTIYGDGHRSDGRCDDGTADGVACDPSVPDFRRVQPGVSTHHVFVSDSRWPLAFLETQKVRPTGGGAEYVAPAALLLVDFQAKRAEFVLWNPGGREERFAGAGSGISGDGSSGVVSFFPAPVLGQTWRFDGVVFPPGAGPPAVGVPPSASVPPRPEARGLFVRYDTRGLPGTPSGTPTQRSEPFEGTRL